MFKDKIAISKNFLIAICCFSLILFAIGSANAMDMNESNSNWDSQTIGAANGNYGINAIDEDKLANSQENILSSTTLRVNGGPFYKVQDCVHALNDGDVIELEGDFFAGTEKAHIIVYKNITFRSVNGATFDGGNISAIFVVETGGSGSSFENLVLKNGNDFQGGAMMIYGKDVSIKNCEFDTNYASSGGGAIYTDYYTDRNPDHGANLLIENCKFKNNFATVTAGAIGTYGYNTRIINCTFESNRVYNKNGGEVYGGAMQIGKNEFITNSIVKDCKFINNKAISVTGTKLSHGGASCLRDGVTYDNCLFQGNSADFGGALTAHFSGNIKNCIFIANSANDYGGAIANMEGELSANLKISDCIFEENTAPYGGAARLSGYSVTVEDSIFNDNYASIDGGAIFINTHTLDIFDSNFTDNSAKHNGGAVYVNGESTNVQGSRFISNVAIADPRVKDDGLGGALYVNGTLDSIKNNVFKYNIARNGSAIYYDRSGKDLTLTHNVMDQNQAWVYALPIYAKDIYYGETEKVGAVIYGGNNIADYDNLAVSNAIYNAALNRYIKVDGQTPVSGATNSGELYQDAREYNIAVLLTVKRDDGVVVYNSTLNSNYLGEIQTTLENLRPGTYTVTATHYEDNYYKGITNQTSFVVLPKVDVSINKATTDSEFNYHDLVVWTLTVTNNGPNDATEVKVRDVLPAGLVYQSSTASVGKYADGVWNIGNLAKGATATLKITTLINKTGDITNNANISAKELDWDLTNNRDSQKITVKKATDLAITKSSNVTNPNYGDLVKWTLTVVNNGPDKATNVVVDDVIPKGLIIFNSGSNYNSGKWSVGTLNVGQSKSLEIITKVNTTGSIKNTATVGGDEYDYNPNNNQASKTINVAKATDLAISKQINNANPNFGDLVSWTVTVVNNGPDAASGVKVSDVLPSGLIYQSSSASVGKYADGVWNVGNLAKGASATLTIVTKVDKTGSIKNTASVSGNEFDYDKSNNVDDALINSVKTIDLEVIKNVNNTNPNYLDLVKWTVIVKNNGPDVAHDIVLTDVMPAGLVVRATTGNYIDGKWTIDSLNVGESKSFEIVTLVSKTGSLTNHVSVVAKEYDNNPANNNASKTINVAKATDLAVFKLNNNANPNFGDLVSWTVTVVNNGPDAASGVKVSDVLPSGLIYLSSSASVGKYADGVWNIGNLAKGASATLTIVTKVNKTGSIKNTASVSGNEFDADMSNNKASSTVDVAKSADLAVIKDVNNTSPNYLDLVKWTITLINNGPNVAHDIVLTDVLPNGLVIKSTTGNYIGGRWTIGSLSVGESRSFEIVTLVNKTGSLTNPVSVVGMEYDYNLANNNASKTINVAEATDLAVAKLVNNTNPNYGELVSWTVTVVNNGPDAASGVRVSDVLPAGLVYLSSSASVGSFADGVWNVGKLAKGASATLTIVTKVDKTGSIKNVVSVSGNEFDVDKSNNQASSSIKVAKATDLSVTKSVNNTGPNYLDLVKWTVVVKNNGPDAASGVRVSDVLPAGLVYLSSSASVGSFADGVWNVGKLAKGASATLTIVTKVDKTGSIKNVVSVSGNEFDVDKSNNQASSTVKVAKAADLAVAKVVNNSAPNYGSLVKWTVTIVNNGPDVASGVRVSDVLPAGLVYLSSSASVGSFADGVWNVGKLAKGASATLTIVTMVNKTGSIKNIASVSGNEFDVDKSNNQASSSVNVPLATDLAVAKVVNNSAPNYGSLVKWTVSVKNNGPDVAHDIVLTDVLPSGLIIKSVTGNYIDGRWTIGALNIGESRSFEIITQVNKTGSLINHISVVGKEYDYNFANNNASEAINVAKAADLAVTKMVNNSSPNYLDLVKWTVVVRNNGPDVASGVRVSDVLPAGLVYLSSSASVGKYANGVWNVGKLAKGASATLTIVTMVNKTGSIKNVVSVSGNEFDVDKSNNQASSTVDVDKAADLAVAKVVNNSAPNYGSLVKWTVSVKNNGPDVAHDIVLTDVLPSGLIIKSVTGNYIDGRWTIEALKVGESKTFEIITLVNKTGSIDNKVSAIGKEYDYNPNNNDASKLINVPKAADLAVAKVVNNSAPNYGSLVKWTVTVVNNGPDVASGVRVSDVLPAGLVYLSSSASVGKYANGVWNVGKLAKGASATLTIVTMVNKTGSIKNVVSVSGNEFDVNKKNNNASKDIAVPKAADLAVAKTVNNSAPNYLGLVKWTVVVRNNGPDVASGVRVSDVLPSGLVYLSSSTSVGKYANGVWNVGKLANGARATLTIVCKVNKTGIIENIVNVTANEFDINKKNNNASKDIAVPKAADLEIIKSVNNSAPNYHDLVKWIITVKNNGLDNASNVIVNEILPEGLIVKDVTGNYTDGKWYLGTVNAFSSKTLEIVTFVNKTGILTNNVEVSGQEYDYDESNNADNSSIDVAPSADLKIIKIVSNPNPNYKENVKWIIVVKNNGPNKATGVKVNEVLSQAFELISSKASKGHYINDIWFIGDLDVSESVNLEIITNINKTGNFTNVVDVTGNEYDYNSSNNKANKSIIADPSSDLEITKTVNNTSPNYNSLVKWVITVKNNGPDKANEIEIIDVLPKGLEFVSYSATKGYYSDGYWKFCCLEVGEIQSLELTTRVKAIGEIKNIATITAKEYDFNPNNNKDESYIDVPLAADLQVTKLVNQSNINYKDLVKWTLIVKNNGPSNATCVVVIDLLPEGLTFISAQGDGTYSTSGTWYVGDVNAQSTKELTIICRADKTGKFINAALAKADQYDYNPNNNRDEKSIVVNPAADLAITKTVSKVQHVVGDLVTYSIEIINNGPDTARNITVNEIMDKSLMFKSAFAASGDYDDVNHIWSIKSLANGEKSSLIVNAIATKEGSISNKVSVVSDTFDNNLNNNLVECIVEIIKKTIVPNNSFISTVYSTLKENKFVDNSIAQAGIEMKETGIPMGLLIIISLISFAICGSNISKKR